MSQLSLVMILLKVFGKHLALTFSLHWDQLSVSLSSPTDYGQRRNFLKADPIQTAELRQRYSDGRPLGISWQRWQTAFP